MFLILPIIEVDIPVQVSLSCSASECGKPTGLVATETDKVFIIIVALFSNILLILKGIFANCNLCSGYRHRFGCASFADWHSGAINTTVYYIRR